MGYLAQFNIPFAGLSLGDHTFSYHIDSQFFDQFEHSVIHKGELEVELSFRKQETMLLLGFKIGGHSTVKCDRCAVDFELPMTGLWEMIVKLGEGNREISENMVEISRNAYEINVAQMMYEYITLMVPQR